MSDTSDDPIIDACLDEVLGGQSPPDLTARILNAWNDLGNSNQSAVGPIAPTEIAASNTDVALGPIRLRQPKAATRPQRTASPWLAVALSLAIIGVGSAFVWVVWDATEQRLHRSNQIVAPVRREPSSPVAPTPSPESVADNSVVQPNALPEPANDAVVEIEPAAPENALAIESLPIAEEQVVSVAIEIPEDRPARLSDEQIVQSINELIRMRWESEQITPGSLVADDEWCRRVHLKLIGREPNEQELATFISGRSTKKREELVDLLLQGETYIEEFAVHWSQTWSDILLASGDKRASREGLEQYLRRSFGEGQPFNETTYELLTATGSGTIGDPNYNGATNYLVAHSDRQGTHAQATTQVSRTFLGLALECSQCHVDGTWSGSEQQQFWELNAFFRQLKIERDRDRGLIVSNANVPQGEEATYYTLPDGIVKAAYPKFVDGTEIPREPNIDRVNRRELLATLVTRSEQFRQTMANRFWAELFGVGFTIPADNIGPHNPPSHPELLAKLGGQFAAHDYDVRALIRWIVLSQPFALSTGEVATYDQLGTPLVFDRFPQAITPPEPVLKRLQVAHQAYASTKIPVGELARVNPTTVPGSVPLELSDVDKLLATVAMEVSRMSKSTVYGNNILESNLSIEQKIQHMFFATLHRAPTANEQKAVTDILANDASGADETALQFIWWALAASREAR